MRRMNYNGGSSLNGNSAYGAGNDNDGHEPWIMRAVAGFAWLDRR